MVDGRVTLAVRRWRRPPPADGSALRSPLGVLCLDRVTIVDEGDISPEDVRRTGVSADELRARRVRQLTELGLTESLEVGYRLSPRGRAVIEHLVNTQP